MKKSSRLVLFVIAGIFGSVALAMSGGPPVPDGCTFQAGRTLCTTVETSEEEVFDGSDCPEGSRIRIDVYWVTRTTTTTTVTYAGASSIVKATDVVLDTRTFRRTRNVFGSC